MAFFFAAAVICVVYNGMYLFHCLKTGQREASFGAAATLAAAVLAALIMLL
ncbi:MAG: hypothetical protein J5772_06585 [Clostridia bacterium]|nr:hypothetical protein [Clostridia bacterium]